MRTYKPGDSIFVSFNGKTVFSAKVDEVRDNPLSVDFTLTSGSRRGDQHSLHPDEIGITEQEARNNA